MINPAPIGTTDHLDQISADLRRLAGEMTRLADETQSRSVAEPNAQAATTARNILAARRLRDAAFDAPLFADPAWDILLDLYASRMEGKQVSVTSLCIAAAVPATTALRWINILVGHNLLVRREDDRDGRRVFLDLTDDALSRVTSVLRNWQPGLGSSHPG